MTERTYVPRLAMIHEPLPEPPVLGVLTWSDGHFAVFRDGDGSGRPTVVELEPPALARAA